MKKALGNQEAAPLVAAPRAVVRAVVAPARWSYERAGRAGGGRRVLTALAVLVVLEVVR